MTTVTNFLANLPSDFAKEVREKIALQGGLKEKVEEQWKQVYEGICAAQGGFQPPHQGSYQQALEEMSQASEVRKNWLFISSLLKDVRENPSLLDQPDLQNELPLHRLARMGVVHSARRIAGYLEPILFSSSGAWNHQNTYGRTPLHLLGVRCEGRATATGLAPVFFEELKKRAFDAHLRDEAGKTALHYFASCVYRDPYSGEGYCNVEPFLSCIPEEQWEELLEIEDERGLTPLGDAFRSSNVSGVKALLRAGADPRKLCREKKLSSSLDKRTAKEEKERGAALQRLGGKPDLSDFIQEFYQELKEESIPSFSEDLKELLVERVIRTPQEALHTLELTSGYGLVHLIAMSGDTRALSLFREKGGNPALESTSGATPLMVALSMGNREVAFSLLEAGETLPPSPMGLSQEAWLMYMCFSTEILEKLLPSLHSGEGAFEGEKCDEELLLCLLDALLKGAPQWDREKLEHNLERVSPLVHAALCRGNQYSFQWLMREVCPLSQPPKRALESRA